MTQIKLSVIIPSWKDPILHKTIDSLLDNSELGNEIEIIVSLDGYWPVDQIKEDPRVKVLHLGKNRGMRGAINAGVAIAKGEFLMRVDEHQDFGEGYDRILVETCKPNWIVTPRRYFLDPVKWEIMKENGHIDRMKLVIRGGKFTGANWPGDDTKMLEESMAFQGSCWIMSHKWWDDVIGELQTEGYGPLIQDSHEMIFKTWKAGGKVIVNKNTWHAHKHRSFPRTHNNGTKENPANCDDGYKYAIKVWGDYYKDVIKPVGKI